MNLQKRDNYDTQEYTVGHKTTLFFSFSPMLCSFWSLRIEFRHTSDEPHAYIRFFLLATH